MAQIAQQDHLFVEAAVALASLDATTKATLVEKVRQGVILDVVLVTAEASGKKSYAKVISYMVDTSTPETPKYTVLVAGAGGTAITAVALN